MNNLKVSYWVFGGRDDNFLCYKILGCHMGCLGTSHNLLNNSRSHSRTPKNLKEDIVKIGKKYTIPQCGMF